MKIPAMSDDLPDLGDVVDFGPGKEDDRQWIILYDTDYENHIVDVDGNVGLLVDCNQGCEVLRLASETVFRLAPENAPDEEPIDAMIEKLQEVRDER